MTGVFPQTRAHEIPRAVFAVAMHLMIRRTLQDDSSYGDTKSKQAQDTCLTVILKSKAGGKHTAVYDQGRNHMYPDKVDDRVKPAGLFSEHGIAPVLMGKSLERIRPIRGQPHAPEGDDRRGDVGDQKTEPRSKKRKILLFFCVCFFFMITPIIILMQYQSNMILSD